MRLFYTLSSVIVSIFINYATQRHNLNSIKDKIVGNGQHGTARWAAGQEVKRTFHHVPFTPAVWRQNAREGKRPTANGQPLSQGIILGCKGRKNTVALVDSDDIHVMMIGASGVGTIARDIYGYNISIVDLREPTRSDGNNLLTLINRYMDIVRREPKNLNAKAKAEKYAKILAKTIINPSGDVADRGQNAYFYDAAEGV